MDEGGFSWKRLLGISGAKSRIYRSTGIPFTKSGRQRKIGNIISGGGCLVVVAVGSALLLGGAFLLSGCSEGTANVYHPNDRIDYVITEFNKVAPVKIRDVSKQFSYQVFITVDGLAVRISSNDSNTFVDISDETSKEGLGKVLQYGTIFIRIAMPGITAEQMDGLNRELQTNKYRHYTKYNFNGLKLQLDQDEFQPGRFRYKWTVEITNTRLRRPA